MNFSSPSRRRRSQAGYALLSILFIGAVMLIAVSAAVPSILMQGTREREEELIWRGEQYARAVRLFFRKNGRFPNSIEELVKPGPNGLRYLRQEYKDPMNREDGSWRLLRVGPAGQLLGSVRQRPAFSLIPQTAPAALPGKTPPLTITPGGQTPTPPPSNQPIPASEISSPLGGDSFGAGPIVGVASKSPRHSVKVYDNGRTYREWEFFWDPSKEPAPTGAPGLPGVPGTPQPSQRPTTPPPPRP